MLTLSYIRILAVVAAGCSNFSTSRSPEALNLTQSSELHFFLRVPEAAALGVHHDPRDLGSTMSHPFPANCYASPSSYLGNPSAERPRDPFAPRAGIASQQYSFGQPRGPMGNQTYTFTGGLSERLPEDDPIEPRQSFHGGQPNNAGSQILLGQANALTSGQTSRSGCGLFGTVSKEVSIEKPSQFHGQLSKPGCGLFGAFLQDDLTEHGQPSESGCGHGAQANRFLALTLGPFDAIAQVCDCYANALPTDAPIDGLKNKEQSQDRVHFLRRVNLTITTIRCCDLIRSDALGYFVHNWAAILNSWTSLLRKTSIPTGPLTTSFMTTAVRALENTIAGTQPREPIVKCIELPARFGYAQLSRFLDALEKRICLENMKGGAYECWGRTEATIAIDKYLVAQGYSIDDSKRRSTVLEYKKIGDLWRKLSGPSDLLLSIFSDSADSCV